MRQRCKTLLLTGSKEEQTPQDERYYEEKLYQIVVL